MMGVKIYLNRHPCRQHHEAQHQESDAAITQGPWKHEQWRKQRGAGEKKDPNERLEQGHRGKARTGMDLVVVFELIDFIKAPHLIVVIDRLGTRLLPDEIRRNGILGTVDGIGQSERASKHAAIVVSQPCSSSNEQCQRRCSAAKERASAWTVFCDREASEPVPRQRERTAARPQRVACNASSTTPAAMSNAYRGRASFMNLGRAPSSNAPPSAAMGPPLS